MVRLFSTNITKLKIEDEKWGDYLSKERILESEGRRNDHDRKLFLGAEILLNLALEILKPEIPRPVFYERNEHGKPYLDPRYGLYVNWSHSGDYILLGIAEHEIGVDLQLSEKEPGGSLIRRVLQPQEKANWECIGAGEQKKRFYQYWAIKESFLKMIGRGFSLPLSEFYVELGENQSRVNWIAQGKIYDSYLVSFQDDSYVAAVTVDGPVDHLMIEYL